MRTLNYQTRSDATRRNAAIVLIDIVCGIAQAAWGLVGVTFLSWFEIEAYVAFRARPQELIAVGWTRAKYGKIAAVLERSRRASLKQL